MLEQGRYYVTRVVRGSRFPAGWLKIWNNVQEKHEYIFFLQLAGERFYVRFKLHLQHRFLHARERVRVAVQGENVQAEAVGEHVGC